jgi:3-oxoacyl-[acyl-carrier protein] reductase
MSGSGWVLVTGANRGIGQAIAVAAAQAGFDVVLHGRDAAKLDDTAAQVATLGRQLRRVAFDIADRDAAARVLGEDIAAHGAYYGVVCNAGIARDGAFPALSGDDWDSVLRTNLDGFYNVVQPLVMPMIRTRKPGRIITLASVSGLMGNRGQVNYSAAKAGIIGASKALAVELASRRITVNCIAPGLIRTGMIDEVPIDEALKMVPAGRVGEPAEVGALAAFLLSEAAAYITRQVISINGGMY